MSERLVQFLYILLRDHVTSGKAESIMENHVEVEWHDPIKYSCPHLEALARSLARRIIPPTLLICPTCNTEVQSAKDTFTCITCQRGFCPNCACDVEEDGGTTTADTCPHCN